ncbi:hypothetical protein KC343_g5132 [Hortaea werneckii]|nr:hypothetical protein KC352_g19069 [Hortaea werneckii]KAI7561895.1 hypothetical protein KC317_g8775 [Hortaea werneckii]KAI7618966.1 hypothetical protein KC346_g4767 [Hortaea werneckii]KAI7629591.1 hypothetical protein KC343_g5132 [Hortaea werneckii]KAI7659318.1 hypothetical protein KC319_g8993 [Hortaea werneckii]
MVLPASNPTKSYWIEAAESPLRHHRSTETLPESVDVVIVGAGYAGAATAYWIHKYTAAAAKQPQVAILEARDICGCATGRNGNHALRCCGKTHSARSSPSAGGQLRPHLYSRYSAWAERFGPDGAMELIRHEMAHLAAFDQLAKEEGIAEETCLEFGETFDAAMTEEAWARLKRALEIMRADHGDETDVVKSCRLIEDACEAQSFTQMKDCIGAVVHPAGQIWPYKFVHAILRTLLEAGNLNLQAHTPVETISDRGDDGWINVKTDRGSIRTRAVVHATNAFASHLLPELEKLIKPEISTLAAIVAPSRFIKHTGAQHWDSTVNNYHLQLPPPHNAIILGGGRQFLVHRPDQCFLSARDDEQILGIAQFFESWPASDVVGGSASIPAKLAIPEDQGGYWTGVETSSADSFPFVGPVPSREGHYIAAGFAGHGMPRILLSAAHIAPLILQSIGAEHTMPELAKTHPALPKPFLATGERIEDLQSTDWLKKAAAYRQSCEESAAKPFCRDARSMPQWSN